MREQLQALKNRQHQFKPVNVKKMPESPEGDAQQPHFIRRQIPARAFQNPKNHMYTRALSLQKSVRWLGLPLHYCCN
jgi:hypothetical protein